MKGGARTTFMLTPSTNSSDSDSSTDEDPHLRKHCGLFITLVRFLVNRFFLNC
jgi:hypothetical protein